MCKCKVLEIVMCNNNVSILHQVHDKASAKTHDLSERDLKTNPRCQIIWVKNYTTERQGKRDSQLDLAE